MRLFNRKNSSKKKPQEQNPLGERLVDAQVITSEELEFALEEQRGDSEILGQTLVRLGFLDESRLEPFLTDGKNALRTVAIRQLQSDYPELTELYRLQSRIKFALFSDTPLESIMVTSALPGEGKTLCCTYLAIISAIALGKKVLLVDADLRYPSIHRVFHLPNAAGLSDVLVDSCYIENAIRDTKLSNLKVLTTGTRPYNPTQLLSSTTMERLLEYVQKEFDLVFLDSPPVLVTADATMLGAIANGTIVVAEAGRTRMAELEKAMTKLEHTHANILGVLLNRYSGRDFDKYRQSYYYSNNGKDKTK